MEHMAEVIFRIVAGLLIYYGICLIVSAFIAPLRKKKLPEHDACELCGGSRGGVAGNENKFDPPWGGRTLIVCDYCHADLLKGIVPGWPPIPRPLPPPPPPPERNPTVRV